MCKDSSGSPVGGSTKCKDCTCEDCKHENLKYCECCGGVHCVDCGEKWTEDQPEIHQFFYPGSCSVCHCTPCCCSWTITYTTDDSLLANGASCNVSNCGCGEWNPT